MIALVRYTGLITSTPPRSGRLDVSWREVSAVDWACSCTGFHLVKKTVSRAMTAKQNYASQLHLCLCAWEFRRREFEMYSEFWVLGLYVQEMTAPRGRVRDECTVGTRGRAVKLAAGQPVSGVHPVLAGPLGVPRRGGVWVLSLPFGSPGPV